MKNKFGFLLNVLLTIFSIIFLSKTIETVNLFLVTGIVVTMVIFFLLYKLFYKLQFVNDNIKKGVFILILLLNTIVQFLICKSCSLIAIANILFNDLVMIIAYILIKRRCDFKSGSFALLISLVCLPLVYIGEYSSICNLLVALLGFSLISIEYDYPLNKRNILKFLIIGISIGVVSKISFLFIIPVLLLGLSLSRNIGKKKTLVIFLVMILLGICSHLYISFNDLTDILFNTYNLNVNSLYKNICICVCAAMIIEGILFSFITFIVDRYDRTILKINLYYLILLCIVFFVDIYNGYNMINIITVLGLVYFSINNYQIRQVPKINYLKRYTRPNEIKKVSVVIPNYNYANYIVSRIDSCVNQTYSIYELIVLDDKSPDNSVEVIERKLTELKKDKPDLKIKFIPNSKNSGNVFKQWQKAFEVSTGDYLWIAEADDLCSKYFLNVVMKAFDNEDVVLSYSESTAIDENDVEFKRDLRDWVDQFKTNRYVKDYICDGKRELEEALCTNNTIANASGVVFKKDSRIDIKKYLKEAQNYRLAGDWYFYSKYLLYGSIAYTCESLNYHRIHKNSVTTTTNNFLKYKEVSSVQNSIAKDVKLSINAKARIKETLEALRKNYGISKEELKYDAINLRDLIKKHKIKDKCLLSIIIPVYNVEKYLKRCINSFIKTLPEKTEVLIINDGSPDNSEDIIKEFAEQYSQIRYIKKKNGGLSSVKNLGLKEANGRYVIFLDSDDYVSNNMYSTMLKMAIDTNSDIVYSDIFIVYENDISRLDYVFMTNYERSDKYMQIIDHSLMAASWNKMVRKSLYDGLSFPEGKNNEDVAVSPILFLRSNKTSKINSAFYYYVQREGSIQNSGFNEKRFVIFETAKMCFDLVKEYGQKYLDMVYGAIMTHQIIGLLFYSIAEIENQEERIKLIKSFCVHFNEMGIEFNNNKYIMEYLDYYNYPNLLNDIKKEDFNKINNYIQKTDR